MMKKDYRGLRYAAAALALSLTALVAIGCGDTESTGASPEEVEQAAQIARQQAQINALRHDETDQEVTTTVTTGSTATTTPSSSSGGVGMSGARSCGEEVYAGGSASCEFAVNVRDAYFESGQGSGFSAYSPVTGKTYTVNCTGSAPATCTAGVNAVIYIP